MGQVERAKTFEQKIINSGIFKLDEHGRPIGIIKLAADKSLSGGYRELNGRPRAKLRDLITELSIEVASFLKAPPDKHSHSLSELLEEFETGLLSYLTDPGHGWGLKKEELSPHLDRLVNKAEKIIKRKSEPRTRKIKLRDTKRTHRRDALVFRMHQLFCVYWPEREGKTLPPLDPPDCNRYIAYLLKACEVEEGEPATIFERIGQGFRRYIKKNHYEEYSEYPYSPTVI